MRRAWMLVLALSIGLNLGLLWDEREDRREDAAGWRSPGERATFGERGETGRDHDRRGPRGDGPSRFTPDFLDRRVDRLAGPLGLSDEQSREMKAAARDLFARVSAGRERASRLRDEIRESLIAADVDSIGVRRLMRELRASEAEHDSLVAEIMLREAGILGPSQRARYFERMPWPGRGESRPRGPGRRRDRPGAGANGPPPVAGASADLPSRFPDAPRIVAFGDVHGDLDATRRALFLAGAIDSADRWAGGDLVVVQTGDQLDRGGDEQAILDLFARLTVEAAAAGGAFHALNGNHELMNVLADLRYVTPEGFADFEDAVDYDPDDTTLAAWPPEERARVAAFRPGGPYARMLARRNTAVVIGPNVFVHGGLEPDHLDTGLERMNSEIRAWLRGDTEPPEFLERRDNLVWSRDYSDDVDTADCEQLEEVLRRIGAERMIVGHTVQEGGITSYCDGRVWCVDVGMAAVYEGEVAVLEIRGDEMRVLNER